MSDKKVLIREDIHDILDISSMGLDFVTAGLGGSVLDGINALLYISDYVEESNPKKKNIIFWEGVLTLGSVLLPALMQSLSIGAKGVLKSMKSGKKLTVAQKAILKNVEEFLFENGRVQKIFNSMLELFKDLSTAKTHSTFSKNEAIANSDKNYKTDEDKQTYATHLTYIDILSESFMKKTVSMDVLKKFLIFDDVRKTIHKIGFAIDDFLKNSYEAITKKIEIHN